MGIVHANGRLNESGTYKGTTYEKYYWTNPGVGQHGDNGGSVISGGSVYQPGNPSYEFPFSYDLYTPNTESNAANTYYPVSFNTGGFRSASSGANLLIMRFYSWAGPAQRGGSSIGWTGSSSHQGGLYAAFRIGDSAWSDMHESQLVRVRRTYHDTMSDYGMMLTYDSGRGSGPFWVRLRGGFHYRVYSKMPCFPTNVTPGGSVFSYNGNDAYQSWPGTTTSVNNSAMSGKTDMV